MILQSVLYFHFLTALAETDSRGLWCMRVSRWRRFVRNLIQRIRKRSARYELERDAAYFHS